MRGSWLSESSLANPMSIYPLFKARRSSWYGPLTFAVVRIETDEGIHGLGTVGGAKRKLAAAPRRLQIADSCGAGACCPGPGQSKPWLYATNGDAYTSGGFRAILNVSGLRQRMGSELIQITITNQPGPPGPPPSLSRAAGVASSMAASAPANERVMANESVRGGNKACSRKWRPALGDRCHGWHDADLLH